MSEKEKLNMALDDVIKLSKKGGPPRGGGGKRGSGGRQNRSNNQRKGNRFFQGGGRRIPPQRLNPLQKGGPRGGNNFRRRKFMGSKPSFKRIQKVCCLFRNHFLIIRQ